MIKRSNKKGLSTIVATLIIILLVFVAIGIFWAVISNVIKDGSEQISLGKLTLGLSIDQVQIPTQESLSVKVTRKQGAGEMTGIVFIVSDSSETETVTFSDASMKELEERVFEITLQRVDPSNLVSVEIAPIFTLESGKNEVGDVKDIFEVIDGSLDEPPECVVDNDCNDNDPSTLDECVSGICQFNQVNTCTNNDGRCPSGCDSLNDNDCSPVCGNGVVEFGEECEPGNLAGEGCISRGYSGGNLDCYPSGSGSNSCRFDTTNCNPLSVTSIFVSSFNFTGSTLGGIQNADDRCQNMATGAALGGDWRSWISDCQGSDCIDSDYAGQRLVHRDSPYRLSNGVVVADNWTDLTDGSLNAPINVDENGNTVPRMPVLTGTNSNGTHFTGGGATGPGRYCSNWQPGGGWAYIGYTDEYQDYRWTTQSPNSCDPFGCGGLSNCGTTAKIYCLRQ